MYLSDYHLHSTFSPDGQMSIQEMAQSALDHGLQEICVTDHVDNFYWKDYSDRWEYNWSTLLSDYHEAVEAFRNKLVIRFGMELGDPQKDWGLTGRILSDAPSFDFVIGSIHLAGKPYQYEDLYFIKEHTIAEYHTYIDSYLHEMEEMMLGSNIHVLGHLTLPIRYIAERYHVDVSFGPHQEQVDHILRLAIERGIGLECNTNRGNTPLPDADILKQYRALGGEIVTIGSDAHRAENVGCAVLETQQLLKDCGFRYQALYCEGKPIFRLL